MLIIELHIFELLDFFSSAVYSWILSLKIAPRRYLRRYPNPILEKLYGERSRFASRVSVRYIFGNQNVIKDAPINIEKYKTLNSH